MATISTQLRKERDPTKEELVRQFFAIPDEEDEYGVKPSEKGDTDSAKGTNGYDTASVKEGQMEINAVLSLGQDGLEDSYVRLSICCRLCMEISGCADAFASGMPYRLGSYTCYLHT
jgi:hypothetical protein